MGSLVHPSNRDRFAACPSGEVSGHLSENALREWSEILQVDAVYDTTTRPCEFQTTLGQFKCIFTSPAGRVHFGAHFNLSRTDLGWHRPHGNGPKPPTKKSKLQQLAFKTCSTLVLKLLPFISGWWKIPTPNSKPPLLNDTPKNSYGLQTPLPCLQIFQIET